MTLLARHSSCVLLCYTWVRLAFIIICIKHATPALQVSYMAGYQLSAVYSTAMHTSRLSVIMASSAFTYFLTGHWPTNRSDIAWIGILIYHPLLLPFTQIFTSNNNIGLLPFQDSQLSLSHIISFTYIYIYNMSLWILTESWTMKQTV